MKHVLLATLCVLLGFMVVACGAHYRAPVTDTANGPRYVGEGRLHRVNAGETLYAIAWMYDLNYLLLAQVNNISSPYTIYTGQQLTVDLRGHQLRPAQTARAETAPPVRPSTPSIRERPREPAAPTASRPVPAPSSAPSTPTPQTAATGSAANQPLTWAWPATGSVIGRFSTSGSGNKGIDIAGNAGDAVRAAAAGDVVYAGSGLLGYGDMIIIKHNERFLSAYAHNRRLLVAEGARVNQGQQIAELGSTGADRDMLHFEIRDSGRPVDPLGFLPRR